MFGWLVFFGVVAVYLAGFRWRYRIAIRDYFLDWEKRYNRYSIYEDSKPRLSDYQREMNDANFEAIMLAVFWFATWVGPFGRRFLLRNVTPDTPMYRELKQKQELKELRKLAREHGLVLPEELS